MLVKPWCDHCQKFCSPVNLAVIRDQNDGVAGCSGCGLIVLLILAPTKGDGFHGFPGWEAIHRRNRLGTLVAQSTR